MLNLNELQVVSNQSDTSRLIFKELGNRQRFRSSTDLRQFRNNLLASGMKIVQDDFTKTFKDLEKLGAGSLITGRRGNASRFIWNYNLKSLAKAAAGAPTVLTSIARTRDEVTKPIYSPNTKPQIVPKDTVQGYHKTTQPNPAGIGDIHITLTADAVETILKLIIPDYKPSAQY